MVVGLLHVIGAAPAGERTCVRTAAAIATAPSFKVCWREAMGSLVGFPTKDFRGRTGANRAEKRDAMLELKPQCIAGLDSCKRLATKNIFAAASRWTQDRR